MFGVLELQYLCGVHVKENGSQILFKFRLLGLRVVQYICIHAYMYVYIFYHLV